MTPDDLPPPGGDRPQSALAGRREILASGVWIAASTLVPFLATAALSVVAGRVLGAELLGQQSLISFTGTLLAALLLTSLTDASIRSLAAARSSSAESPGALERWTFWAHLAAGAVTAAALVGVGVLRGEFLSAWLVLALTVLLDALAWAWCSRIVARDGWGPVARRRLVSQVLSVVLGVAAVLGGLGITGIFLGAMTATVVLLVLLRPIVPRPVVQRSDGLPRPLLRLWLMFAAGALLSQVVSGRVEILFLGAYADGVAIAQYSVAVMLVTSAVTLPAALAGAAMPVVAAASGGGEHERAREAFVRALRVTAVLSLPLTAVIVAVGPAFVVGLYGEEFREAGQLTRVVAIGAVIIPCGRLATAYWSGLGQLRLPILAGSVGAALEIGLALALIPDFAARGAVSATLVGQGMAAALLVVLSWRALGRVALGVRGWLAAAAASTVAALAGSAAAALGGLLGAVAGGVSTVLVFLLLAVLLGRLGAPLLDTRDGDWLVNTLPQRCAPLVRPLVSARSPGTASPTAADPAADARPGGLAG